MTEAFTPVTPPVQLPANEPERLAALRRYNILDTPPEAAFDRITALAARLFDVPIALVSLIDESRGWFKSAYGFDLREVQRDDTICGLAILSDEVLMIPDTRLDDRLVCNPFVQAETGLRFYVGAPLLTQERFNLGTLCLIDTQPRSPLSEEQLTMLTDLAAMVMDELELRLAARKVAQLDTALLQVTQGVSAVTGEAFFAALVRHFTQVLGVDYAYIGLITGDDQDTITTIAVCSHQQASENFAYHLQDTPCQEVIRQRKLCCYPCRVQALFPHAPLLAPLQVESYAAVPFFDASGAPLGLLGVMGHNPMENVQLAESLLTIFALRIVTELERQQAEERRTQMLLREQQYSRQLHGLTQAALDINSSLSIEEVLQVITRQAYRIIGTHQAVTSLTVDQNWAHSIHAIHLSDKYAQWRDYNEKADGSGIYAAVCHLNRPMRLTQTELEAHPQWKGFGAAAEQHPPLRGWLAAPLMGRDGHNIGLIQLSDKYAGEFTEDDEAMLVQLAQMASIALENTRLYEAEQSARAQAESANRMKDEFLAVLSHELRSPLSPILGWAKLLRTKKMDETKTAYALEAIERNAKLQTQLIEDLLDVSRILLGKLSLNMLPVNLVLIMKAALETVRLAAEAKSIDVRWTIIDPGLTAAQLTLETTLETSTRPFQSTVEHSTLKVLGDAARLQQVIWNLLSNAVKFTPEGGQVDIRLELISQEWGMGCEPASNNAQPPPPPTSAHAQITIQDTGQGIAPEFLPYVFDYFRQADATTTRKFGGLGLGLAIVRQIVELHGGTVWAESDGEGQGATFTVKLPLLKPERSSVQPATDAASSRAIANPLHNVRVLIVDDDADVRELVKFMLEQAGAMTVSASSVLEALELLAQAQPDILLSDIGMPEQDGYSFIRHIRSLPPDRGGQIPAIALTAYAGDVNQQQALAAGFQQHLAKPIEADLLVSAIVKWVRS
ncbi:MAG: ATP-binding protein [Leptolyngbyaceae cyanobacterium bins.349]|nr:ATP-binding protein [Leptolyngbyaceae cyanobacterium bins.349]